MKFKLIIFIVTITVADLYGQTGVVTGTVSNESGLPLTGVTITVKNNNNTFTTTLLGGYKITVPSDEPVTLLFSHIGYNPEEKQLEVTPGKPLTVNVVLRELAEVLKGVEIAGEREVRDQASITAIKPRSAEALPSPFGDFNKILSTLPGVMNNNELSSAYSVRGGNFDENLVYVNDIPVYRPFLISSGQQEGLSFVNTDLVESLTFSSGGWQPQYGDRLSSVLDVKYKKPTDFGASVTAGLLGGSAHVEGNAGNLTYLMGARYKSSQYLLNTLETEGEYLPDFTDIQAFLSYSPGTSDKLEVLASYARNRYLTRPRSRETEFGTLDRSYRFLVGFAGTEILEYDTYQGGITYRRRLSSAWESTLIASAVYAMEREFTDVEGAYRLCDIDKNPSSGSFNECVFIRGAASNYQYGRNLLDATIINLENRNEIELSNKSFLSFGLGFASQTIDDQLNEYSFIDSADYVSDVKMVAAENSITNNQFTGYIQHSYNLSAEVATTYGLRVNYSTLNNEMLISPRVQLSYRPDWRRDIVFTTAFGIYQQPPFYRELRNQQGQLNPDLQAQKSLHLIGGIDYNFKWWDRDFKFTGEIYYKQLEDVVIYDIDNVKIRYYGHNNARAFTTGLDLRVAGEFVEGVESWFSLGILNARENVAGDGMGYIRRPTDQRVNFAIFFQDHLPDNPSFRVSLNAFLGTGLPFGPPENVTQRNSFRGDGYRRLDVGFSKIIQLNENLLGKKATLILGAEVLNLFGISNAISYTWISDFNNDHFAVPNSLSARFLNLKLSLKI